MLIAELHMEYSASSKTSRSFTNTPCLGIFSKKASLDLGWEQSPCCSSAPRKSWVLAEAVAGLASTGGPRRGQSGRHGTRLPGSPPALQPGWLLALPSTPTGSSDQASYPPGTALNSNRIVGSTFVPKVRTSSSVI